MNTGRPSKYDPQYCEALIEHMAKGLSFESFAGLIGVCKDTTYEWAKVHPSFSEAKKIGVERSRLFWESAGIEGLWEVTEFEGGKITYRKALNVGVWVFNMKNRFGWKEKQPEEVAQISNSQSAPLTDEQFKELIKVARGEK